MPEKKHKNSPFSEPAYKLILILTVIALAIFGINKSKILNKKPPENFTPPVISPTPVDTDSWQTYKNPDNLFSVRYPETSEGCRTEITLSELGLPGRQARLLEIYCGNNPRYIQLVYEKSGKPLMEWWYSLLKENREYLENYGETAEIRFAGTDAMEITYRKNGSGEHKNQRELLFEKNDYNYLVVIPDYFCKGKSCPNKNIEQKLLETFEFTDSNDTSASRGEVFCGGIMGKVCPEGYICIYDGSYPDSGGICVKN